MLYERLRAGERPNEDFGAFDLVPPAKGQHDRLAA